MSKVTINNQEFTIEQLEALKLEIQNKIDQSNRTLLKRPDGSLISEPEEGTKISLITTNGYDILVLDETFKQNMHISFKLGNVFLREDKDLADKKAKMLSKQLNIQYEIDRLNALEGYVFDPKSRNFFLYYDHQNEIVKYGIVEVQQSKETYMSFATAEKILIKYSQKNLQAYLGIL